MRVKEIMNKAIAVDHDITLAQAAKVMSDKNIGSIVVVKGEEILGILTERDILKNASNLNKKLYSVMTKNIVAIDPDDDLDVAARMMNKNQIKHMPVVKSGRLVGIITATDLVAHADDIDEDFLFG